MELPSFMWYPLSGSPPPPLFFPGEKEDGPGGTRMSRFAIPLLSSPLPSSRSQFPSSLRFLVDQNKKEGEEENWMREKEVERSQAEERECERIGEREREREFRGARSGPVVAYCDVVRRGQCVNDYFMKDLLLIFQGHLIRNDGICSQPGRVFYPPRGPKLIDNKDGLRK